MTLLLPPTSPLPSSPLPVLFRDESLLVVNKPSGMLVHNGWAREPRVALGLARELAGRYVYPVHRLDRGTSGVLIFALSSELARLMQAALARPEAKKLYLALVRGVPPAEGSIVHALAKQRGGEKREAITSFATLGSFERYSLVLVKPMTGRLHQVRRHMKHISHPLIGDVRYGKSEHNRLLAQRFGLCRLALHALAYEFTHPVTRAPIRIEAELGNDLLLPLTSMGLRDQLSAEAVAGAISRLPLAPRE